MRVLLVEDDQMVGQEICKALGDAACAVDWVTNGEDCLAAGAGGEYELIMLDLGLPDQDGLRVLSTLRSQGSKVPVLVVTARDGVKARVSGLDSGADDYLVKPFNIAELLARIRALVRRNAGNVAPILTRGALSLDPACRTVTFNGKPVSLTSREFAMVQALLIRPGSILSRSQLEERLYGWNDEVESNAVEFIIHNVRRKLGPTVIKNVRGIGWTIPAEP